MFIGDLAVKTGLPPPSQPKQTVISPGPWACFIVAAGLLTFGIFVLIKAGIISGHLLGWLSNYGLWAMSLLFLARAIGDFRYVGVFKKIRATKFTQMDSKYYSPLCLGLSVLGIILEFMS